MRSIVSSVATLLHSIEYIGMSSPYMCTVLPCFPNSKAVVWIHAKGWKMCRSCSATGECMPIFHKAMLPGASQSKSRKGCHWGFVSRTVFVPWMSRWTLLSCVHASCCVVRCKAVYPIENTPAWMQFEASGSNTVPVTAESDHCAMQIVKFRVVHHWWTEFFSR